MSEETSVAEVKEEEKKLAPGTISFKNGKGTIVVDDKGTTEDFNTVFIAKMIKPYTRDKNLKDAYRISLKSVVKILESEGALDKLDRVIVLMTWMRQDIRPGIRAVYKDWTSWLNYVGMMKNIKTTAPEERKEEIPEE
jgi:hypothetical protein